MCKEGRIFNIQRFSTADGPGIRTVVFLKGCPLRCAWCHNPESQSSDAELFFKQDLCISCGSCQTLCPANAHIFDKEGHRLARENCAVCGACAKGCFTGALELCGETMTPEKIMDTVIRDKPFYEESGGGLTLSGGEPLMQFDFTATLLKLAKEQGLHTAIETSGYTTRDITLLHPVTDLWLYDIKLLSNDEHKAYTGVSNGPILENLKRLDEIGAKTILRCPIIPHVNLNEGHFEALVQLSNSLSHVTAIHLEPYHPLGLSKSQQLSKHQPYQNHQFLESAALAPFVDTLQSRVPIEVTVL